MANPSDLQPRDRTGRFGSFGHRPSSAVLPAPGANESGAVPANGMPVLGTAAAGYADTVSDEGCLVKQVRFSGVKPDDAPDGTAAVILYTRRGTTEVFYRDGVLHDGSGGFPSRRHTTTEGKTVTTRGYRGRHRSSMTEQDSPDGQPARVIEHPVGEPTKWEFADGRIETYRMAAGHYQDPAPGVPAVTVRMADGGTRRLHFPFGRQSDLADGSPAEEHRNADGNLVLQARYYDGFLFDGDDGEPAVRTWRDDGTLAAERRYQAGKPMPGAGGEPAVVEYNPDGSAASSTMDLRGDPPAADGRQRPLRAAVWPYADLHASPVTRGGPGA